MGHDMIITETVWSNGDETLKSYTSTTCKPCMKIKPCLIDDLNTLAGFKEVCHNNFSVQEFKSKHGDRAKIPLFVTCGNYIQTSEIEKLKGFIIDYITVNTVC